MKVTLNWLKEFVDIDLSPQEIAHQLTLAGLEVESVQSVGNISDSVITVRIEKMEKHPNADRLTLCQVSLGSEVRQIVCGAKNMQVGDIVPLAQPGSLLPDGKKIEQSKIRGIESAGMLCSEKELGLAEEANGLYLLPSDTPIGKPIVQALSLKDTIFEINVTPNRSDCLSVIGIAREIAALTQKTLKPLAPQLPRGGFSLEGMLRIEVKDATLCPRYTARMIRGVRVAPSPAWVQRRLQQVGIRSINNVVDATNYVMIETGQPLHAFDFLKISNAAIEVVRANQETKILALDDKTYALDAHDLLIGNPAQPLAIAGVMGGLSSGVTENTTTLVLEAACFDPSLIRKTSKRLGLSSESSYRFERGVDPNGTRLASDRLAKLILAWGGGEISQELCDTAPNGFSTTKVSIRKKRAQALLGVCFENHEIESVFRRLSLSPQKTSEESWECEIPTFRRDLTREVDLIEEIARVLGYERIEPKLPKVVLHPSKNEEEFFSQKRIREYLKDCGFFEVIHYSFCSPKEITQTGFSVDPTKVLLNPLSEDLSVLRPSLIPSLLSCLQRNLAHQSEDLKLYEMRTVYQESEKKQIGFVMAGKKSGRHWALQRGPVDFYDLKGVVEGLLSLLGVVPVFHPSDCAYLHPGQSTTLKVGQASIGHFGMMHPQLSRNLKIEVPVLLGEIDFSSLSELRAQVPRFQPLPRFPFVTRDLTVQASELFESVKIIEALQNLKISILREAKLVDVYQGDPIEKGKKALTYSLCYQDLDRTLTDTEVNETHTRVLESLKTLLPIEWR